MTIASRTGPIRSNRRARGERREQTHLTSAECEGCGTSIQVPFVPSPTRPAYCGECREVASIAG
ncbi:MAG TPA: CxxC-x17-CxxC domain-containing protein [Chloroflexota bacterium]|nr:CxxC-x17-CxxC domain-containing protein [Chloroflexota bacterium]